MCRCRCLEGREGETENGGKGQSGQVQVGGRVGSEE